MFRITQLLVFVFIPSCRGSGDRAPAVGGLPRCAIGRLVATILVLLLSCSGAFTGEVSAEEKRVLILYSHQANSSIIDDWDRGIRRGLESGQSVDIKIDIEYLDLGREGDPEFQNKLVDILQHKYADVKFDLVIPVYIEALEFTLRERRLFENVPIVFCSVPNQVAQSTKGMKAITGVVFKLDFAETVAIARTLFPRATRLLVLSGTSDQQRNLESWARSMLRPLEDSIEIEFISGLPLPELCQELRERGTDSIVLMLSYDNRDDGSDHHTVEALKSIVKGCRAPIFGLYETLIGHGVIGGKMVSAEVQGELAGQLATRVLNGEPAEKIEVVGIDGNRFIFDDRELKNWNVDDRLLPVGSSIRFQQVSFWEQNRTLILAVLGTLVVQSLVIGFLIFNRSKRLRAEKSLRESRSEARDLAGKLLSAQESERKRIARELHDDLTQRLAASAIEIGKLVHQQELPVEIQGVLSRVKDDIASSSENVHRLSRQIHPSILNEMGLEEALRNECSRLTEIHEIPVSYQTGELPESVSSEISLCLFRIGQESLWNVAKHAHTDRVEVELTSDDECIYLAVRDWGDGFDTNNIQRHGGLGLASMKERARLVGGELRIDSKPSTGTLVEVTIPIWKEGQ